MPPLIRNLIENRTVTAYSSTGGVRWPTSTSSRLMNVTAYDHLTIPQWWLDRLQRKVDA